jgi:hypothetical protein
MLKAIQSLLALSLAQVKGREEASPIRFELLPIDDLKAHEATIPLLLQTTLEEIQKEGRLRCPILVESRHHIILDGHHRYSALQRLGCKRVPAYVVDYFDDSIELSLWPGAVVDHITKEEVVAQVVKRKLLYPPKTTRHTVKAKLQARPVPLEELKR